MMIRAGQSVQWKMLTLRKFCRIIRYEMTQISKGIQEILRQHGGWVGQIDDYAKVGGREAV